jgi:hypothetical protein
LGGEKFMRGIYQGYSEEMEAEISLNKIEK